MKEPGMDEFACQISIRNGSAKSTRQHPAGDPDKPRSLADTRVYLFIVMTSLTLHCQDILDTLRERQIFPEVWSGAVSRQKCGRRAIAVCGSGAGGRENDQRVVPGVRD